MSDSPFSTGAPPTVRRFGAVNWLGLWTLYRREVQRFFKVATQTVAAPVVTSLLFFVIFTVALEGRVGATGDVPFMVFLAPGLVMMTILQNAFTNCASSIMTAKVQGNIVDVLMPPLSPWELTLGYTAGGVTRGLLVGATTGAVMWALAGLSLHSAGAIAFFAVAASVMLSLTGVIGGIWAEKFDHMAAITNFVIVPLSFLSGTFYSIDRLPAVWQTVAHFNPFFYAIDGFRFGFIGHADTNVWFGAAVLVVVDVALFALAHRLLARGYKLKN